MTYAEWNTLRNFFEDHEEGDAFRWTPPVIETELLFTVDTWSGPIDAGWDNADVTITVKQCFDE